MIDKRTEASSVNYADILAKGLNAPAKAEEPAAQAVAWNAPSMNVAAAMASLMLGNAASATTDEPALTTSAMRDAVDFAEGKSKLKALVNEAERVISGMQPGPEKTNALGALAAARAAGPADIRTMLAELNRIIAEATSKELGVNAIASAREEAEAEREARIKQLRMQIDDAFDDFEKKGYITKQEREESEKRQRELDERSKEIEYLSSLERRTPEQEARLALLMQQQEAGIKEAKDADTQITQNAINHAQANGDIEAVQTGQNTLRAIDENFELQNQQMQTLKNQLAAREGISPEEKLPSSNHNVPTQIANSPTNSLGIVYSADPELNAGTTLVALNTPSKNDGKDGQQVSEQNAPGW